VYPCRGGGAAPAHDMRRPDSCASTLNNARAPPFGSSRVRPEARDLCSCVRQSRNQWSVVTQIRHRVSMDMSFWLQLYCEVCEHTLDMTLDTAHVQIASTSTILWSSVVLVDF